MRETTTGEPPASGRGYRRASQVDAVAALEARAAELERRLLALTTASGQAGVPDAAVPPEGPGGQSAPGPVPEYEPVGWTDGQPGIRYAFEAGSPALAVPPEGPAVPPALGRVPDGGLAGGAATGGLADASAGCRRAAARRPGRRGPLRHWRLFAMGGTALAAGVVAVMVTAGNPAPGWPASVDVVQGQIKAACANPDVAAEPGGLNFACGRDTQQVLWVFSLLTSGDNPRFTDPGTGREGLEPISAAQGGDIAWSLNLRHPYNPADPVDSLMVAARAVNSIIAGATVTSASGGQDVEPGLESTAAGCRRYTGSPALVTRAGYPAACAAPLTATGTASLVSDVFGQWMTGGPAQLASDAGVLFENAGNPGSPQVQAILASLPASGR
jgi:hypothetical protein